MILVTGGSGHLGANLIRRLLDDGESVRALVRNGSNNGAFDDLKVDQVLGDICDPDSLKAAVRGCDRVYHCAAIVSTTEGSRTEIFQTNVLGTRNVLQAAAGAGVKRVVVSGSFSAVGYNEGQPSTEADPFNPLGQLMPYQHSKAAMEHECLKAVVDGLDVVIAVSCAIIGPHDYKPSRVGRTFIDYANGKMKFYVSGGFEYVAARDIAEGHILAMKRGRAGHKYILSTEFLSLDQIIELWSKVTGRPNHLWRLSPQLMAICSRISSFVLTRWFPKAPQRFTPGAIRILRLNRRANIKKAQQELGYQPTSVAHAVEEACEFFMRRGLIRPPSTRRLK
jgi:nucleoside-diphosphate-sugar epimerase